MLRKACLLPEAPCQLQPYNVSTSAVKFTFHHYENYSLNGLSLQNGKYAGFRWRIFPRETEGKRFTLGYARTNIIGSRTSFVIASVRSSTHVFRGNPFQAHGLEQSYHPAQPCKQEKYNTKSKM